MNRRRLLQTLPLIAAGLFACRGAIESDSAPIDPEIEALRRASESPGGAIAAIETMQPPAARSIARLPFDPARTRGVSRSTHLLHHRRHYAEYLHRWILGERQLLHVACGRVPEPEPASLRASQETARQAANMVVLHEIYWRHFIPSGGSAASKAPVKASFTVLRGDREAFSLIDDTGDVPLGEEPLAVIDWQRHAWLLDHSTPQAYAQALGPLLSPLANELLAASAFARRWDHAISAQANREQIEMAVGGDLMPILYELCMPLRLDAQAALEGLRRLAGPKGHVLALADRETGLPTVALAGPSIPVGIWRHDLLAAATGR